MSSEPPVYDRSYFKLTTKKPEYVNNLLDEKGQWILDDDIVDDGMLEFDLPKKKKEPKLSKDNNEETTQMEIRKYDFSKPLEILNLKPRIEEIASLIMENPEKNVYLMDELIHIVQQLQKYSDLSFNQMSDLTVLAITAIFGDILPIWPLKDVDTTGLSKEAAEIAVYENSMLKLYKKFLKVLQGLHATIKMQAVTHLLKSRPDFNLRTELLMILFSGISNKNAEIRALALKGVDELFVNDFVGYASLEFMRMVSKKFKNHLKGKKKKNVMFFRSDFLKVLLRINFSKVDILMNEPDEEKSQREKTMHNRAQKKYKKRLTSGKSDYLKEKNRVLKELKAQSNEQAKKERGIIKTETLSVLFHLYLSILVDMIENGPDVCGNGKERLIFIKYLFEGIRKHVQLVNVELMEALLSRCSALLTGLPDTSIDIQLLLTLETSKTITVSQSGLGNALTIDHESMFSSLFKCLLQLSSADAFGFDYIDDLVFVLGKLFLRKTTISLIRVQAFVKRLIYLSCNSSSEIALKCIDLVQKLINKYPEAKQCFYLAENPVSHSFSTMPLTPEGAMFCDLTAIRGEGTRCDEVNFLLSHYDIDVVKSIRKLMNDLGTECELPRIPQLPKLLKRNAFREDEEEEEEEEKVVEEDEIMEVKEDEEYKVEDKKEEKESESESEAHPSMTLEDEMKSVNYMTSEKYLKLANLFSVKRGDLLRNLEYMKKKVDLETEGKDPSIDFCVRANRKLRKLKSKTKDSSKNQKSTESTKHKKEKKHKRKHSRK
eukprot:TRINITY_DN2933_c5_g6_i1.p1 TRINITY_DN2933_c5_g6~~TRINITY_DN2933_c5_g6_i1.p1  ORF type:complete len:772 (+),score=239.55 TRINITY_DN2933_c5_g6_i1:2252-4567(+)